MVAYRANFGLPDRPTIQEMIPEKRNRSWAYAIGITHRKRILSITRVRGGVGSDVSG